MPHDANGSVLKVGDQVIIPGIITFIGTEGEFCNITVETEHAMPGNGIKSTFAAINTKQVELAFQIGQALTEEERGKAAYNGYLLSSGGRSLVSGQMLPLWGALSDEIKKAWIGAANAVHDQIFRAAPIPEPGT